MPCWRRTARSWSSPAIAALSCAPSATAPRPLSAQAKVKFPIGTRVEISFGPALPCDGNALFWAQLARRSWRERDEPTAGRSSPWWYDAAQFHELLYASGDRPVRELIASLDGCTGAKAGEIVAAARLGRALCKDVTRDAGSKAVGGRARECPSR